MCSQDISSSQWEDNLIFHRKEAMKMNAMPQIIRKVFEVKILDHIPVGV